MPVIKTKNLNFDSKTFNCTYKTDRRIKRLSLKITQFGDIFLLIPPKFPLHAAENFLHSNLHKVQKHLKKLSPLSPKRTFLGKELSISIIPVSFGKKISFSLNDSHLEFKIPEGVKPDEDYLFREFLKIKSKEFLLPLAEDLAKEFGFSPKSIKIGRGKTRWGSCTANGSIRLNSLLMSQSVNIIKYVIFHELCHLRHLNHSQKFWKEVEGYVPDYKVLRKNLKGVAV